MPAFFTAFNVYIHKTLWAYGHSSSNLLLDFLKKNQNFFPFIYLKIFLLNLIIKFKNLYFIKKKFLSVVHVKFRFRNNWRTEIDIKLVA